MQKGLISCRCDGLSDHKVGLGIFTFIECYSADLYRHKSIAACKYRFGDVPN